MGDKNLINAFTHWRGRFLRQAMRMLPSEEDAEDVLQDAFVRLWSYKDRLKTDNEAVAMATVTVRNMAVDRFRQLRRTETKDPNGNIEGQSDAEDAEEDKLAERHALVSDIMRQVLTPLQLRIIELREYEGKSYDEVARELGMTQPAVRMQLSRARKAIREKYNLLIKK